MELLHKLGIDWKLLVAQTINFFILLAVLYKFVYRPVLEMLEKRSKTIEKGVHDARAAEERLAGIEKMREERMKETEREIGRMLEAGKQEAEKMKLEIQKTARAQADDMLRRTRGQLAEEKEKMLEDVKKEVSAYIVAAAAKIIGREFSEIDQKRLSQAVTAEMS